MQTIDVEGRHKRRAGRSAVTAAAITRRFGKGEAAVHALRGISCELSAGELTAIMGPSGSGKSTLLQILAGLDRPTSGTISIGAAELARLSDDDLVRLRSDRVGLLLQEPSLVPTLTAEQNVTLPLEIAGRKVEKQWLDELLATVGIADRRSHRPAELSGGQQQRVAVARALVTKPKVLFADEPTGNLDSQSSKEVLQLLRKSVDEWGQTIVMVTHEAGPAAMADRILFIADGRIVRDLAEPPAPEVVAAMHALIASAV